MRVRRTGHARRVERHAADRRARSSRAWLGGLDDDTLPREAVSRASRDALEIMTPGAFADGDARARARSVGGRADRRHRDARAAHERRGAAARGRAPPRDRCRGGVAGADARRRSDRRDGVRRLRFDDEGVPPRRSRCSMPVASAGASPIAAAGAAGVRATSGASNRRRRTCGSRPARAISTSSSPMATVLEGGLDAVIDPSSDRIVGLGRARARRSRRAARPAACSPTSSSSAISAGYSPRRPPSPATAETFSVRDEVDGQPRWRSIETPGIATRGLVRARRRVT